MANSSASIYDLGFYQPEEFGVQSLKLIASMLKQVAATLDAHVELLQQEHQAVEQLHDRQQALIGVDALTKELERDLELLRQKPTPAVPPQGTKPGLGRA